MKININGHWLEVDKETLSYDELVLLVSPVFSIVYSKAAGEKQDGVLAPNGIIHLKEGTIISAMITGAA